MENASKALIMAGSVLLSLLIIGALVIMFNNMGSFKQTEANYEQVQKLAEYNRKFETFNRQGLYGSEILSLANLVEDYNIRQSDLKGYTEIRLEVYTKGIIGIEDSAMNSTYISARVLREDFEELQRMVNEAKSKKICGNTVEKWSGMTTLAIEVTLKASNDSNIKNNIKKYMDMIDIEVSNYLVLKSEMTEYKNKKFSTPQIEYDSYNGRITKMVFKEIGL